MQLDNPTYSSSHEAAKASVSRMLAELAALTGDNQEPNSPTLELQFDDILTRTSLMDDGATPLLSITAFLPRGKLRHDAGMAEGLLWDAGEGRHVLLRHVPAVTLRDERSLMDEILNTYDQARAWLDRGDPFAFDDEDENDA